MQWKDLQNDWDGHVAQIMQRWPELDENDVSQTNGDQERFIRLVAKTKNGDMIATQMDIADWLMAQQEANSTDTSRRAA